jgi:hypothetical protein
VRIVCDWDGILTLVFGPNQTATGNSGHTNFASFYGIAAFNIPDAPEAGLSC